RRTPPRSDRPTFTARNAPCPPIDARLSHRIHRIAIASTYDDNTESCYAAVSRGPESAALGRSSLLSSQPGQSIASFGERDQLSVRLCDDVSGSGDSSSDRLAGGDDQPPDRPLLLRAEGLRRRQSSDARVQGRNQGRLQSTAQGRADDDLGAVTAAALL